MISFSERPFLWVRFIREVFMRRVFILVGLFFLSMCVPFIFGGDSAYAQPQEDNKSIYSKASDAQLDEAKKYYKLCISNKSLSALKDCKCAATEYLETRMRLGNKARVDDIIKENLNGCLKNNVPLELPQGRIDYSKVPKAYIDEAMYIYSYCNENPRFSNNYDCQCYTAEFLTQRIKNGKRLSQDNIMLSLRGQCRNVVATTGANYSWCLASPYDTSGIGDNVTQKDYCECVAREWAKRYRNFQGNIDSPTVQREMKFASLMTCKRPEMYSHLDK